MSLNNKKKVLIVTYYWPPAGGPGVQRWLNFVKYLPEYQIEPIVYCPKNPNYPIVDQSLEREIPEGIEVLKHPIFEPYRFAKLFSKSSTKSLSSGLIPKQKKQSIIQKLLLYVRGNFFIPDARKFWVKPSIKFLKHYITTHHIDTVITTGPPHSLHLIGFELKNILPVKWITDFRDPWTTIGYHKKLKLSKSSIQKHLKLEQLVLDHCDSIITTSYHTKEEFKSKTSTPIKVITNGFDEVELEPVKKDSYFSISHIGSLLSDRNPTVLWEVLSELIAENLEFKKFCRLNFAGVMSEDIKESLSNFNLMPHTNILGYINHQEALILQRSSQLLLVIEIDSPDTKAIIPGKLFEYLNAKTPIIALGPKDADVSQIIKQTKSGDYFTYRDKAALKQKINDLFQCFLNDKLISNTSDISQYSRKHLTSKLAQLILEY